ncbi:MAG TPA: hypothetical protein VN806_08465 [Caulobacteraceae bacterium]|nr:hypothetical protein [Caulobacteraceae bacterium]
MTTLTRHFKAAEPAWSPAVAAREIDRLMSRLPTSLIEALLKLEADLPARLAR